MKVTQPNSRSITIVADSGVTMHVPYRFFWNGHERLAESIVLSAAATRGAYDVRAFFLFGEIRDRITEDGAGITLSRLWSVKSTGALRLSLDLEFEGSPDLRWLFPGVSAGEGIPASTRSFLGDKTSYPAALALTMGGRGVLFFSRTATSDGDRAGIGIGRTERDDEEARLSVEVRFPGVEEPSGRIGPRPEHLVGAVDETIESPGAVQRSHDVFLAFAPAAEIALRGASAVLGRLTSKARPAPSRSVDTGHLKEAVDAALSMHLLERGGVAGIREVPGSAWLSSSAGLGMAVALRRLFPRDGERLELALRLADFSLKGQVAAGFFYESFDAESGQWRGVRGQAGRTLLSLAQSARIAELLLLLASDLAGEGRPHEKYYLAGQRFVDFFIDDKARLSMPGSLHAPTERAPAPLDAGGLGGLELFFPTARILQKTGRDRYRKALEPLVRRFSAVEWDVFQPPRSRDGRGPDAEGALLAVRLFLEMRALGYRPAEPTASSAAAARARAAESARLFASLLVQWIRVHSVEGDGSAFPGCLVDSFNCQRVIFAGNETALLLLRLASLTQEAAGKRLFRDLARHCLQSVRRAPLGTEFVQHTRWDAAGRPEEGSGKRGRIDARRLTREVLAGLQIAESFPRL